MFIYINQIENRTEDIKITRRFLLSFKIYDQIINKNRKQLLLVYK